MAMTEYTGNTDVIAALGTTPQERGLTTEDFKAKFDEGLKAFVTWFNTTHKTEFDAHLAENATQDKAGHIKLPENWIAPILLNGWENYGDNNEDAGYYKDTFGVVHLKGLVKNGTNGTAVFTLPIGYIPTKAQWFAAVSNNAFGYATIDTLGNVTLTGSNIWVSLAGISFRVIE